MDVRILCCSDNLLHARFTRIVTVANVFADAFVKQDWLLGHNAHLGPEPGYLEGFEVTFIQ